MIDERRGFLFGLISIPLSLLGFRKEESIDKSIEEMEIESLEYVCNEFYDLSEYWKDRCLKAEIDLEEREMRIEKAKSICYSKAGSYAQLYVMGLYEIIESLIGKDYWPWKNEKYSHKDCLSQYNKRIKERKNEKVSVNL